MRFPVLQCMAPGTQRVATPPRPSLPLSNRHPPTHPRQARLLASHPSLPARLRRLHFADTRDLARGHLLPPLAALSRLASLRLYQRDGFELPGPLAALAGSLTCLHAAGATGLVWAPWLLCGH